MFVLRTLLVALLVSSLAAFASANIILNPSFESGSGAEVDDWLQASGPSGSTTRSVSMPNSGDYSAYMQADHFANPAAPTPYSVEQTQPVGSIDNTLNYNLSFSAKVDSLDFNGFDMFYQILWLDQDASDGGGVRGETLTSLTANGISTSYQVFSLNDIDVPDGTDSFQLRFQLSPGAVDGIVNGLYIDDVFLDTTTAQPSGDFDQDGDVDGDDFLLWQRADGSRAGLSTWQTDYNGAAASIAVTTAIPEPSTLMLAFVSGLFAMRKRFSR